MFPRYPTSRLRRQSGFLLPLALFILVGMLALALAASRLTGQSATSATLEALSTQAFYAAESGGQYVMNQLFYSSAGTLSVSDVNGRCDSVATTLDFSTGSAPGLSACSAEVSCVHTPDPGVTGTHFYTVTSTGSCGSGSTSAQRTIQIAAFME